VLVAGGDNGDFSGSDPMSLSSAEVYDFMIGTWSPTGSLVTARTSHTATLLANGTVVVAGGGISPLASAELYDPAAR
jgi:hypothetical protein